MFTWKTILAISVALAGCGAAIDRLISLRHKTRLHLLLIKWWHRLDETRIPDFPKLLAGWLTSAFGRASKRKYGRTMILYLVLYIGFVSLASISSLPAFDSRILTLSFEVPSDTLITPNFFDELPVPHALSYLAVLPFDLIMIAATLYVLRLIGRSPWYVSTGAVCLHLVLSVIIAILTFAAALHAHEFALYRNLLGMRSAFRTLQVAEPFWFNLVESTNNSQWKEYVKTNALPQSLSTNAIAILLSRRSSYWHDIRQTPGVMMDLIHGEIPIWKGILDVKIQDRGNILSYTREDGNRLGPSSLLLAGTIFYPALLILALLLAMLLSKGFLVLFRQGTMYFFDLSTEKSPENFAPGTLLGIVAGLIAAIADCAVDIIKSGFGK